MGPRRGEKSGSWVGKNVARSDAQETGARLEIVSERPARWKNVPESFTGVGKKARSGGKPSRAIWVLMADVRTNEGQGRARLAEDGPAGFSERLSGRDLTQL